MSWVASGYDPPGLDKSFFSSFWPEWYMFDAIKHMYILGIFEGSPDPVRVYPTMTMSGRITVHHVTKGQPAIHVGCSTPTVTWQTVIGPFTVTMATNCWRSGNWSKKRLCPMFRTRIKTAPHINSRVLKLESNIHSPSIITVHWAFLNHFA